MQQICEEAMSSDSSAAYILKLSKRCYQYQGTGTTPGPSPGSFAVVYHQPPLELFWVLRWLPRENYIKECTF